MAILRGDELSGLIGPIVIRRRKDGSAIVQSKARHYKKSKKSEKSTRLFGLGSTLACEIRIQLSEAINFYDPGMINRFNTQVKEVLKHCYNEQTNSLIFELDSFSRLKDFEFNIKSPLVNYLWVKPAMVLESNSLKIIVPELKLTPDFIFPAGSNTCMVTVSVTQINIAQARTSHELVSSFEINADQALYPEKEIVFEVANQCLCVVAIGLSHYNRNEDIRTPCNSKTFSPANIIGAILTPGVHIESTPATVDSPALGEQWNDSHKLKL